MHAIICVAFHLNFILQEIKLITIWNKNKPDEL